MIPVDLAAMAFETRTYPESGGLLDQTIYFTSLLKFVHAERERWKQEQVKRDTMRRK